jgi:hypothetical protein
MRIILNRKTLEPALVQVTYSDSSVRGVIPLRVSEADPTHKLRQIAILARPQKQMPVIAHNAIAANTHGKPLRTLSHDLLETVKVVIPSK